MRLIDAAVRMFMMETDAEITGRERTPEEIDFSACVRAAIAEEPEPVPVTSHVEDVGGYRVRYTAMSRDARTGEMLDD